MVETNLKPDDIKPRRFRAREACNRRVVLELAQNPLKLNQWCSLCLAMKRISGNTIIELGPREKLDIIFQQKKD